MAAASAGYQAAAGVLARRRFPAPGQLVDIGGRRVHVMAAGGGSPAVVIVPALGDTVLGWVPVWRALAECTRACVYDRAGIGWSDPPPAGRRTFDDMARELRCVLAAAGIAPPYLVVGHSMGGVIARRFAARYAADMAAMVLVDSSHEDQARRWGASWRLRTVQLMLRRHAHPLGLRRLTASAGLAPRLDADLARMVPAEHRAAARAITLSSRHRRAHTRELRLLLSLSDGQPPNLGSLPLTVLTAASEDDQWTSMQAELAATSTQSRHVTADQAGHYIHQDDPALVINTIRDLVTVTR